MHNPTVLWPALVYAAALLTGCGEGPSTDSGTQPDTPAQQPPTNPPLTEPATADPELTVVDARAITAMRQEAKAKGQVLVIDCWATWCPSCVAMFPKLHLAMDERGQEVRLVSLCFDEGQAYLKQARAFLSQQQAWEDAYLAMPGDAKPEIAKALSDRWDGGALPAVFVYRPDGTTAYKMLQTQGEVDRWVDQIAEAVDGATK